MSLAYFLFIIFAAVAAAKLEIQIEGKDGWAKNLPTWKISNRLTRLFLGNYPFTGYHFWVIITVFLYLHFPFFLGLVWNISNELKVIAAVLLTAVLEDFLWFVFNPAFGIRRFNKKEALWHGPWLGPIPLVYLLLIFTATLFLSLSYFFL
ncbi:MAG: hypothetical protein M1426_01710 [Patescibacteria group bacterium]|nr:hypothetical protein [Patescibacteria group bacterium]